jgi:serine/threonine protein kinase
MPDVRGAGLGQTTRSRSCALQSNFSPRTPEPTQKEARPETQRARRINNCAGARRDVKPANVLVSRDSVGAVRVRLCDFGVSILTDETRLRSAGVTAVGLTAGPDAPSPDAGTRLDMAPEIIEEKAATTGADVYALGVMLYQISIGDFAKPHEPENCVQALCRRLRPCFLCT